jgi:hypothetical protein
VAKFPAGGGKDREDEYLFDRSQPELGIKTRGDKKGVEIKGLVNTLPDPRSTSCFPGHFQIWCKWTSNLVSLQGLPTLLTRKTRWIRKYDAGLQWLQEIKLKEDELPVDPSLGLPAEGCNVELTKVAIVSPASETVSWWSLGFEAFGSLQSIESNLTKTVAFLANQDSPMPPEGQQLSYPAWLGLAISESSPIGL